MRQHMAPTGSRPRVWIRYGATLLFLEKCAKTCMPLKTGSAETVRMQPSSHFGRFYPPPLSLCVVTV